jgi:hypothetical protein
MSIENDRTGKPSRYPNGEGCQEQTRQPSESAYHSGGVSGDGMLGRATEVTREICSRGGQTPTPGTTPSKGKAGAARAEVGVLHSSVETPVMGAEQRRGSCADACEASRERGDGLQGLATPTVPETATGVRKLQRTLYRQAKSKPKWKAWSLYGDVCRKDVLEAAFRQVAAAVANARKVEEMAVEETRQNQSPIRQALQRRTPTRTIRTHTLPPEDQMAKLKKQTEERHSESRMREIRKSGSMRGSSAAATPPVAPYST